MRQEPPQARASVASDLLGAVPRVLVDWREGRTRAPGLERAQGPRRGGITQREQLDATCRDDQRRTITGELERALKSFTAEWEQVLAFGLMTFPEPLRQTLPGLPGIFDPGAGCRAGKLDIAPKLGTAGAIASRLDVSAPDQLAMTPMAGTMQAAQELLGACADCTGKKTLRAAHD